MCGIVAVVGHVDSIDAALDALAHRGPDGRGTWRRFANASTTGAGVGTTGASDGATGASDDARSDIPVALGHTRLAVIDPQNGAQPIANEDGSIVAVVNGEIYDDNDAIRRDLRSRGHVLRTRCDAELLVHLYEEYGDDVVHQLRGEIAFVLWDGRRRRLLAARDRFGIKPLVWAKRGDGVAIASEAKALFALGVPARWDAESFFHAAHVQYTWPDRTLFEGVYQVEPGHLLVWDGTLRTRRYYEPMARPADIRATLEEAVRIRERADARVCVQLSGGIDSTTVAALARKPCFTVAFEGGGTYDERALAEATTLALDLPLHVVSVSARDIVEDWPRAVVHGEGLAINGHIVGKYLLSRAMRDAGFKVALTGEGADEIFAGYPHLRRDASGVEPSGHAASRGVMLPAGDALDTTGVLERLGYVPTWLQAKASLGARVRQLLAPDFTRAFEVDPYGALIDKLAVYGEPFHISQRTWMRTALATYILRTLGDGMEMAHGIEGRVPFLDHRLVEAARAIGVDKLVGAGIDKPVLRDAVANLVPADVLARPKHPFLAPPISVLAPELLQDTLRSCRSAFIDRNALLRVLDHVDEPQLWDPALMLLLSASVLQEAYCR